VRAAVAIGTGIATSAEPSADLGALLPVRNAIADALDDMGWERDEALRVLVSAVEGLVSAVEHGSAAGGRVSVRCEVYTDRAELLIVDGGRPDGATPRLHSELAEADATSGRGLALIHGLADTATCRPFRRGTELRLGFETPARGSDSMSPPAVLAPPPSWASCPTCWGQRRIFEDRNGGGLVPDTCPGCLGLGEILS
jgi:anti-sigma regulatory factor (Ser/Thr protein kinase)